MDHIWLAPSSLNKSLDLKLGSQWSNTLYRSFIVTLYLYLIYLLLKSTSKIKFYLVRLKRNIYMYWNLFIIYHFD